MEIIIVTFNQQNANVTGDNFEWHIYLAFPVRSTQAFSESLSVITFMIHLCILTLTPCRYGRGFNDTQADHNFP